MYVRRLSSNDRHPFSDTLSKRNFFWFLMDWWLEFEALNCCCCLSNDHVFLFRFVLTVPVYLDILTVEVSKSHSVRHTTICMTLWVGWYANRRHIYLITHITHKRQASMVPAGFKPAIKGAAESLCLRPRGHWEWPYVLIGYDTSLFYVNVKFFELAVKQFSINS